MTALPVPTLGLVIPCLNFDGAGKLQSFPLSDPFSADSELDTDTRFSLPDMQDDLAPILVEQVPAIDVTPQASPPRAFGNIKVNHASHVTWDLNTNKLTASGGVEVVYTSPTDQSATTLNADSIEYDGGTGLLLAHRGARLQRTEGSFIGDEVTYNLITRTGFATNAIAETDYFRMRGERIEAKEDGTYVIENGVFTTCIRGRPDYQVRAKHATIYPHRYISARGITFYAGATPLITLPSFKQNLRTKSQVFTPVPGYNKSDGLFVRLHDTPILEPRRTLEFDGNVNLRHTPTGFVTFENDLKAPAHNAPPPRTLRQGLSDPLHGYLEQLTPPTYREYAEDRYEDDFAPRTTFGATLQNNQYVYNRRRTDLQVSRFPELDVRFTNVLGHNSDQQKFQERNDNNANRPPNLSGSRINPVLQAITSAPFLLDFAFSAGAINEHPTNVTQGRFSLQTNLATQPILIGRRISLRFALTDWLNAYSDGQTYNLFSPEGELDYLPTRTTRLGIGYRFANDTGSTPFAFDRRDVRHEVRMLFQIGGPTAFGFESKFDLERSRAYDSELAVVRNFDCMQVGVAYRLRTQQFSLIFNLLPPVRDRAARQTTPLQRVPGSRPQ